MSENIIDGLMFIFTSVHLKTNFILATLETRRDSSDVGSVQRGKKDAEVHTSGAKRAQTWHKMDECTLCFDQSDPRVAQRVRSKGQDVRNSTSSQSRRETSSYLVRVRKVMRAGHRQGGGVGGARQASSAKTTS